jgi:hypothetical protein
MPPRDGIVVEMQTLDAPLLGGTVSPPASGPLAPIGARPAAVDGDDGKLGTLLGVVVPVIMSIFGVVLYLRLGFPIFFFFFFFARPASFFFFFFFHKTKLSRGSAMQYLPPHHHILRARPTNIHLGYDNNKTHIRV